MQRRVSIKDVAREAGVSIATVSNTMNRPDIVAPSTRLRVLQTMRALGFVRREGARQLHGLPSPVVAVGPRGDGSLWRRSCAGSGEGGH
ncbi:LacI family DNA-binding transcriptional regulator [Streptomyces scopuliridis]